MKIISTQHIRPILLCLGLVTVFLTPATHALAEVNHGPAHEESVITSNSAARLGEKFGLPVFLDMTTFKDASKFAKALGLERTQRDKIDGGQNFETWEGRVSLAGIGEIDLQYQISSCVKSRLLYSLSVQGTHLDSELEKQLSQDIANSPLSSTSETGIAIAYHNPATFLHAGYDESRIDKGHYIFGTISLREGYDGQKRILIMQSQQCD